MERVCFRLRIRQDLVGKYVQAHRNVWPEMRDALRESGWKNYSLFLADDGELIGYLECDDFKEAVLAMGKLEVNSRWQAQMTRFFEDLDSSSPEVSMTPIREIFHLG